MKYPIFPHLHFNNWYFLLHIKHTSWNLIHDALWLKQYSFLTFTLEKNSEISEVLTKFLYIFRATIWVRWEMEINLLYSSSLNIWSSGVEITCSQGSRLDISSNRLIPTIQRNYSEIFSNEVPRAILYSKHYMF